MSLLDEIDLKNTVDQVAMTEQIKLIRKFLKNYNVGDIITWNDASEYTSPSILLEFIEKGNTHTTSILKCRYFFIHCINGELYLKPLTNDRIIIEGYPHKELPYYIKFTTFTGKPYSQQKFTFLNCTYDIKVKNDQLKNPLCRNYSIHLPVHCFQPFSRDMYEFKKFEYFRMCENVKINPNADFLCFDYLNIL